MAQGVSPKFKPQGGREGGREKRNGKREERVGGNLKNRPTAVASSRIISYLVSSVITKVPRGLPG
jgi:hypothetical protein